jgi:putative transposase
VESLIECVVIIYPNTSAICLLAGWLTDWAKSNSIELAFIQPDNPQQKTYVEHYNQTERYGGLSHYLIEPIDQIQRHAINWLWTYDNERPDVALTGITPMLKLAAV